MQTISKFNKRIRFLCVFDIFCKYAWVVPLKDKKGKLQITITNGFQKILDESKCKPNKIWLDKGSEFYNESMKLQLKEKSIKMHSTDNEEKSVAAKIFVRIFKE